MAATEESAAALLQDVMASMKVRPDDDEDEEEVTKEWGSVEVDAEETDAAVKKVQEKEAGGVKEEVDDGDGGGTVDLPEMALKSEKLNEEVESPDTEIKKVLATDTPYTSAKSFEDLNLTEPLLKGLYTEMKFERPSRIQAETLPMILSPPYANLIAQAHNGSGKTTCFVLGMLGRVDANLNAPQALCVCPTRELAIQNEEVLLKMAKYTGITCACTAGADDRVSASRRGKITDQVVIGTPGTLKRWMSKDRILDARRMKILVFDEADHMLATEGFQDDSMRIMSMIARQSPNYQILLFSATFSERVKAFARNSVPRANEVFVPKEDLSLDVIKQYRVRCPSSQGRLDVLRNNIFPLAEKLGQSIIFVRTRENASFLHTSLQQDGHRCTSIQGGMSHEERDRVIREYRSGETKILISTDVLARGFDQAQVTLVVNYDIPVKMGTWEPDYELYLHRIGRSGRFGRKGAAFNLVCDRKGEEMLNKIEDHFDRRMDEVKYDDEDAFERVLKEAGLA
ncbi:hypothetical protein CBR_g40739 [Chara braunii]|uniref:RNA helicase n=1 Tax=Chara braunii TaxID=69332 RepID=A0A388LUD1_CHABU|nr:hypothetical protein CBR_g40739 [Chara braunii]|eukprot:GBG85926.1 hypothetical protein CBR_g40739 [Chara braunii]